MKKENKNSNLHVRMTASDLQKLDFFTSFWYKQGVDMGNAELARNAMDEYIETYDISRVLIDGNMIGVRVNPNNYNLADLFNMVADAQEAMIKEENPSKKYLLSKQFELLQKAYNLEMSAISIKNAYKIETPEQVTQMMYKINNRIVGNVGGRK